jgi:hypothetical protein
MAHRSGIRRVDPGSPLVDLDVVFADDARVDALARPVPDIWCRSDTAGRPAHRRAVDGPPRRPRAVDGPPRHVRVADRDPLMDLLRTWRGELTTPPLPPAPDVRRALRAGAGGSSRRSLRAVLAVTAAIAALLVGSATIGSRHAAPDSALWAVTRVLWPGHVESVTSSRNVQAALHDAQVALATGRTQEAQLAVLRAASELGNIDEDEGRGDMQAQVDELWRVVAPQGLPVTSLAPELLAGGPVASPASPASASPSRAPGTDAAAAEASSKARNQPRSGSAVAVLPTPAGQGAPGGPALAGAGSQIVPELPAVDAVSEPAGTGPVLQQPLGASRDVGTGLPPAVGGPAGSTAPSAVDPAAPAVATPPVVQVVTPAPVVTAPVDPGPSDPAPATDPATAVPTPAVLTPPAPVAPDPAPSSVPDTNTSAALPVPAPAPQPSVTDPVTPDHVPDASDNGATDVSSTDVSLTDSTTAESTPTN